MNTHSGHELDWTVELIETGLDTNTGGRIKRLIPYMDNQTFMLTWGDGVSDLNLLDLLAFHRRHGKLATMTVVRPPARFGLPALDRDQVVEFSEKPQTQEGWIDGAFFVLEPEVYDYIDGDTTLWEKEPLEQLAKDGQLMAYRYTGFWQCMDTLYQFFLKLHRIKGVKGALPSCGDFVPTPLNIFSFISNWYNVTFHGGSHQNSSYSYHTHGRRKYG